MTVVVSDTSPIRALGYLGLIHILRDLYVGTLIPPAVEQELRNPATGLGTIEVEGFPFIHTRAPSDRDRVDQFRQILDGGESEALALAIEVRADLVLIDEAEGRAFARSLGLVPVGVLGTLTRAKERGLIDRITPLIDRLQEELRFFISPRIRAEVIRSAGE